MALPPGSQLVFEQFVASGAGGVLDFNLFRRSDTRFNDWLGRGNELSLMAVVDRASASGTVLAAVEEGSDEELAWWQYPSIEGAGGFVTGPFSAPGVTVLAGYFTEQVFGRQALAFRRLSVGLSGSSTVTARVRIWAAGRGGSRRFHHLLLKQRIEGTDAVYTPEAPAECLLEVDKVVPSVLTEDVSGGNPSITVQAEHSPNGRIWTNAQASAEITAGVFSGMFRAPTVGIDATSSARVRYRQQLSGTTPAATVRLWVTGRDVFPR